MQIISTEFKGDMTFIFKAKSNYGRTLMYPVNKRAMALCDAMGVATLSNEKAKFIHNHVIPLEFESEKEWYEYGNKD